MPEPSFDESAENALRFFGLEAHDVERIRDQLALIFVYVDDDSTYSWETRDALHTGLIYAYEAAIRASERAKVEALLDVLTDMANDTMQSRTTENGVVTSWWLPSAYVERLFKAWDAFAVRAGRAS